jgi:hypothetical protein
MARLRIYTVHINPSRPHPYEEAEFVDEGFNRWAFIFTGVWALYHRLWWQALALFVFGFIMVNIIASGTLSAFGAVIIDFGVRLLIGYHANEWRRRKLAKRGYLTADITSGESLLRAEQRFFDRYFALHPAA